MQLRLTLDTNALIYAFDSGHDSPVQLEEIESLFRHTFHGSVNLAITSAVIRDLDRDTNQDRRKQLLFAAAKFPAIGAPFRAGLSKLGSDDMIVDEADRLVLDRIQQIVFPAGIDPDLASGPNKINDVDHLFAHLRERREIFVTMDRAILSRADLLDAELGLRVMTPRQALEVVERTVNIVLVAEDFRSDFMRVCAIIVEAVQAEPTNADALQAEYAQARDRMLRAWPKLVGPLARSRVDAISTPMPGFGEVVANRFAHRDIQNDQDPFAPFYAREQLSDTLADLPTKLPRRLRKDGRYGESPDLHDLLDEQERCRTLLATFVGALEVQNAW